MIAAFLKYKPRTVGIYPARHNFMAAYMPAYRGQRPVLLVHPRRPH